jgi:hypothetical protein
MDIEEQCGCNDERMCRGHTQEGLIGLSFLLVGLLAGLYLTFWK